METFEDTTENTARPRGSGGGLQSKGLPDTAQRKGAGGDLQTKSANAAAAGTQQQPGVEPGPEQSDQSTTPEN